MELIIINNNDPLPIMELATIEHNIDIFLNIKDYEKIIVHNDNRVDIDGRYFQIIRRRLDWWIWSYDSSRQATYNIIYLTYESLKFYRPYMLSNIDQINQSLNNLFEKFTLTYSNYPRILGLIEQLQIYYNAQRPPRRLSVFDMPNDIAWYYLLCINNKNRITYDNDQTSE